jgi:hypothetical protein
MSKADVKKYSAIDGDGSAIVWFPNQPEGRDRNSNVWSYVCRGWCNSAVAYSDGVIPADEAPLSELTGITGVPSARNYKLSKVGVRDSGEDPLTSYVTLTYSDSTSSTSGGWLVTDLEPQADITMMPLHIADLYDAGTIDLTQYDALLAENELTLNYPGLDYTITTYQKAFSWSESNLLKVSSIEPGALSNSPTGITSPVVGHWKYLGKSFAKQSGITRVTEHWLCSPTGIFPR